MKNHRTKLLVISLCLWSFLGSHEALSQNSNKFFDGHSSPNHDLHAMAAKFRKRAIANRLLAEKKALIHGWKVTKELPGGGFMELQEISSEGTPVYYESYNNMVVKTSRSNYLTGGELFDFTVDGSSMTFGVWDSGKALPDHQEYKDRFTEGDNARRVSSHATHVLGTAIASGVDPAAKGVAFNANGISFDWNQDEGEAAEQAAEGLLISNHSYGISGRSVPDWFFGSYIVQAKDWDEIMHAAPYYLMVTAAGNIQRRQYNESPLYGTKDDGYDLLLGFAVAKNGLTVAAADNIEIDGNGSLMSADIASFSSFGPTNDGRIKPDITGAGVNVYSSYSDDTDSYKTLSGTSMASPGVAASLLLLQQYYHVLYGSHMRASTVKGIALHTADEAGDHPGPDPKFGWGILNAKRAAELIDGMGVSTELKEVALEENQEYEMKVTAKEGETLKVSISWTDPEYSKIIQGLVNSSTRVLVNDLDVRVVKEGDTLYPWKLDLKNLSSGAVRGDNQVDPFEQIEIENASGEYTIIVSHKGELKDNAQVFSLIVSGLSNECSVMIPESLNLNSVSLQDASVSWDSQDDSFYEVLYKETAAEEWESELVSENTLTLSGLSPGTSYSVKVRTLCTEINGSDFSDSLVFSTTEEEEEPETPDPGEGDTGDNGNDGSDSGDGNDEGGDTGDNGSDDTNTGDGDTGDNGNDESGSGDDNTEEGDTGDSNDENAENGESGDTGSEGSDDNDNTNSDEDYTDDQDQGDTGKDDDRESPYDQGHPNDEDETDNSRYIFPEDPGMSDTWNGAYAVSYDKLTLVTDRNNATVRISGSQRKLGPFYIFDLNGRYIKQGEDATRPISVDELSHGTYVLTLKHGSRRIAKKFVK